VSKLATQLCNCVPGTHLGGPGLGKSYLAKMLASQVDFDYLFFNITRLASVQDLADCFDTIMSHQARRPHRRLLVFFDEINAELGGQPVWSSFLAPILDGVYRRGGHLFRLQPAVWIFAGTRLPGAGDEDQGSTKASDFATRINGPIINFFTDPSDKDTEVRRLETIYLAMALARRRFPDLVQVQRGALEFFRNIIPAFGVRSLEYVLDSLRNVQYGELRMRNLPEDFATIERWCTWEPEEDLQNSTDDNPDFEQEQRLRYRAWHDAALDNDNNNDNGFRDLIRVYETPPVAAPG